MPCAFEGSRSDRRQHARTHAPVRESARDQNNEQRLGGQDRLCDTVSPQARAPASRCARSTDRGESAAKQRAALDRRNVRWRAGRQAARYLVSPCGRASACREKISLSNRAVLMSSAYVMRSTEYNTPRNMADALNMNHRTAGVCVCVCVCVAHLRRCPSSTWRGQRCKSAE
jgi:hypothetical protein